MKHTAQGRITQFSDLLQSELFPMLEAAERLEPSHASAHRSHFSRAFGVFRRRRSGLRKPCRIDETVTAAEGD